MNLTKELRLSQLIDESIGRIYDELETLGYKVVFHKDDGNYYLDINCTKTTMNFIVYDRDHNTVSFTKVVDDEELVFEEMKLEYTTPNRFLMRLITEHIK